MPDDLARFEPTFHAMLDRLVKKTDVPMCGECHRLFSAHAPGCTIPAARDKLIDGFLADLDGYGRIGGPVVLTTTLSPSVRAPARVWPLVRSGVVCAVFFILGWLCGGCGDNVTQDEQTDAGGPDACYRVNGVCTVALPPSQPPDMPCLDCDAGVDAELATHPPLTPPPACVPVCLDGGV